jgi:hypothetical protein
LKAQVDGNAFEQEVARLYEALGYVVKRDLLLSGQQVDLLAEKYSPGIGPTRILVECKYLESGSVSNQTIHDFASMFKNIAGKHGLTAGVLVTNRAFSRYARASAADAPITLLTREDLERGAINLSDTAYFYVSDYESSAIFKAYVPLQCEESLHRDLSPPPDRSDEDSPSKPQLAGLEDPLLGWLQRRQPHFLTILADFGSGKTSLLQRLKYLLCKKILGAEGAAVTVPVYFPLKELLKFELLDDYISSVVSREFRRPVPLQVFWKYLESGAIVPLLDGFDEAATFADASDRRRLMLHIAPLINRSGGGVIMTCRPTFFVSPGEYSQLVQELGAVERRMLATTTLSDEEVVRRAQQGLESIKRRLYRNFVTDASTRQITKPASVITLRAFDKRRIAVYLSNRSSEFEQQVRKNWRQVYRFLHRVYDLADLMRRPFLLEIISDTVLSGQIAVDNRALRLGAASLYDVYTWVQFNRESESKNRSLFTVEERQRFAHLLAMRMHTEGYGGIAFESIAGAVATAGVAFSELGNKFRRAGEEATATDIAVCSFLTRREDGRFYFAHKSFMEFFLARQIRCSLESNQFDPLLDSRLPNEVLYFLGSYVGLDSELASRLLEFYDRANSELPSWQTVRRNILGAICFAGTEMSNFFIRDCRIDQLSLPQTQWRSARLRSIWFEALAWKALLLRESILEDCTFQGAELRRLSARDTVAELTVRETKVGEIAVDDHASLSLQADGAVVELLTGADSKIDMAGSLTIHRVRLTNCEVNFSATASETRFSNATIKDSRITSTCYPSTSPVEHSSVQMEKCLLLGISALPFLDQRALIATGRVILSPRLLKCRGVLLFDESYPALARAIPSFAWEREICLLSFSWATADAVAMKRLEGALHERLGSDVASAFVALFNTIRETWAQKRVSPKPKQ